MKPPGLFLSPDTVFTPRVLKDGSDSVGALGALNRVYLNIGLFSEEWLLHFRAADRRQTRHADRDQGGQRNSVYWQATENMTPDMALFFLKVKPDKLAGHRLGQGASARPGQARARQDRVRGKLRALPFLQAAAPISACSATPARPARSSRTAPDYFDWMRKEVMKPDFLDNNFLSTDRRISIQEMGINACSPLATNAIRGDIWDNFSSETYKELPPVGQITVYNPVDGTPSQYDMPGGGRGYVRPASLISLWTSAPYLQNNSVGKFNWDPSVESRMDAFEDGIHKMLWPERRDRDYKSTDPIPASATACPARARSCAPPSAATSRCRPAICRAISTRSPAPSIHGCTFLLPWIFTETGDVQIGPIPAGTPVNLLANINPLSESTRLEDRAKYTKKLIDVVLKLKHDLKSVPPDASDADVRKIFDKDVPALLVGQQVSRLHRQQGPLLRQQSERRRQERADRVLENLLAGGGKRLDLTASGPRQGEYRERASHWLRIYRRRFRRRRRRGRRAAGRSRPQRAAAGGRRRSQTACKAAAR